MLPAKAAGSLEKSCGREQMSREGAVVHDGCVVEHLISLQLLNVCFCPQAAAIIPFFQVLDLIGSQPGYTVQEGTEVNCFCCYRWAGWEEIKTLLRGGS